MPFSDLSIKKSTRSNEYNPDQCESRNRNHIPAKIIKPTRTAYNFTKYRIKSTAPADEDRQRNGYERDVYMLKEQVEKPSALLDEQLEQG